MFVSSRCAMPASQRQDQYRNAHLFWGADVKIKVLNELKRKYHGYSAARYPAAEAVRHTLPFPACSAAAAHCFLIAL